MPAFVAMGPSAGASSTVELPRRQPNGGDLADLLAQSVSADVGESGPPGQIGKFEYEQPLHFMGQLSELGDQRVASGPNIERTDRYRRMQGHGRSSQAARTDEVRAERHATAGHLCGHQWRQASTGSG